MTLRRHVPELALEWLIEAPEQRWRQIHGTLCFADISGFTALAERLAQRGREGGEELVETLGGVFADMLDLAAARGGSLLKFGGDALLLFFQGEGHVLRAASAAVEMRQALRRAADTPTSVGPLRLSMSVGLHSGPAHFFLVGGAHRELVLLGPAANLVVATENSANAGEILVSAATAAALPKSSLKRRSDGEQLLRWRRAPIEPDGRAQPRPIDDERIARLFPHKLGEFLAPGPPEPEHRVACIAFIRFSGTDAILAEQGPDSLADALQTTVTVIQTCVEEAGVTMLAIDIDRDGGKFFLGAGVPYGHEDDEGVMLRALRRIADAQLPLPLQIGVNRGHVFAAEVGGRERAAYSAMGDTTNTAARIASKTPIGAIFAHPSVLDQSLTLFATRPADALVLKGKKAPLVVYEVGEEIGLRRREGLTVETFIGRQAELQVVHEALASLATGHGTVVQIIGEAGLGKSRLLREALAGIDPNLVLSLRAEPYGANSPYRLFRDPLRTLLGVARSDPATMLGALSNAIAQADTALTPYLALIGEVVDIPAEPSAEVRAIDPGFRPQRIADALIRLLETSRTGSLVIAVDDAQWCDEASAQLLAYLARACADRPWLLVATCRDGATGFVANATHEVRLGPMDAAAVRALVIAATEAAPLRPHEIEIIVGRASGNPLFATEIVRAAREAGSLDAVPQSLEATLAARVDALDPSARRILRYAAVLGRTFSRNALAEILQAEGTSLDHAALARLGEFLDADDGDQVRFRSGLVRDTTYEGVAYRIRTRLHQVAGATLERLAEDPTDVADALAVHFSRAGEFQRTWHYARVAADRARGAYANADATQLYELALDAARRIPDIDLRTHMQVWTDLGAVRGLTGMYEGMLEAYRRAQKLAISQSRTAGAMRHDDPIARAELLVLCASAKERVGAFPSALRDLTKGIRLIQQLDSVAAAQTRARLEALTAMVLFGQDRAAQAFKQAKQAIDEARRVNERESLGRALIVLELSRLTLEGPGDGTYLREALAIAEELGHVRMQANVRANLGFLCAHAGRWDEGVDWFTSARDAFLRSGDPIGAAFQATNLGEMLVKQRRFGEALPVLTDALRVMRGGTGWAEGIAMIEIQLARIQIERGAFDEADVMLARVGIDFAQMGKPMYVLETSAVRSASLLGAGKPEAALDLLERAIAAAGNNGVGPLRPILACARASAYAHLEGFDEAEHEISLGLTAAREQGLPYEEAMLLLARNDIARRRNRTPDPEDAKTVEQILAGLGVRESSPNTEP